MHSEDAIPTKEQCEVYWGKYRQLYDDQVRVLRDGSEKTQTTIALQRMTNAKYLVLSGAAWKSPAHPLYAVWDAGNDSIIKPTYDPDDGPWHSHTVLKWCLLLLLVIKYAQSLSYKRSGHSQVRFSARIALPPNHSIFLSLFIRYRFTSTG
jgi:hypothetical protein